MTKSDQTGRETAQGTHSDPVASAVSLTDTLADIRDLLAQRQWLERELATCEMDLREAWLKVPHMPVRSSEMIEMEVLIMEKREARLAKAAHGDREVAAILKGLIYG